MTNYVLLLHLLALTVNAFIDERKNVLFIISDDMRADLGAYGDDLASPIEPKMHTPHIDALASKSLFLRQAYVQCPLCAPSRSSFLTGRRPETIAIYDLFTDFRKTSKAVSLPELFRQNGYDTLGMGKIFHNYKEVDKKSWTAKYYNPEDSYTNKHSHSWTGVGLLAEKRHPLPDQLTTEHAKSQLRRLAVGRHFGGNPFFMAVGYHRPHFPLIFPERFLDLYPEEEIQLGRPQSVPKNFPTIAWNIICAMFSKDDVNDMRGFNQTINDKKALEIRRAYFSTISYVDSLVGELTAELETAGLSDDTIVVFVGDHGYQLGEHNQWCKQTTFDVTLRTPAMIRIPGRTDGGVVTDRLTEFVDIFPTVVEAAGLQPVPLCPAEHAARVAVCREGTSLLPLVDDPASPAWKNRVFSQIHRDGKRYGRKDVEMIMGKSLRTEGYRYTEWVEFDMDENESCWDNVVASELYDLTADPEETVNVAGEPEHVATVSTLSGYLRAGWRQAQEESRDAGSSKDMYHALENMVSKNEPAGHKTVQ